MGVLEYFTLSWEHIQGRGVLLGFELPPFYLLSSRTPPQEHRERCLPAALSAGGGTGNPKIPHCAVLSPHRGTPGLPAGPMFLPSAPPSSSPSPCPARLLWLQCAQPQGTALERLLALPAPCMAATPPQHVAAPLSPPPCQDGFLSLPRELPERRSRCFHKQRRLPSSLGPSSEQGEAPQSRPCPGWRKHLLSPSRWLLSHPRSRQIPEGFPDK